MADGYTKGPWVQERTMWTHDGRTWHAVYAGRHERICHGLGEADAHLIAAAPDLLEACRKFVDAYRRSHQLEKTDVALRAAEAAIAKAVGEVSDV